MIKIGNYKLEHSEYGTMIMVDESGKSETSKADEEFEKLRI